MTQRVLLISQLSERIWWSVKTLIEIKPAWLIYDRSLQMIADYVQVLSLTLTAGPVHGSLEFTIHVCRYGGASLDRQAKENWTSHCVAYVTHTQLCMPRTGSESNDSQTIHEQGHTRYECGWYRCDKRLNIHVHVHVFRNLNSRPQSPDVKVAFWF